MSLEAAQELCAQLCSCVPTCVKVNIILGLRTDREFGETAAFDLFALADFAGNQLRFTSASTLGVVTAVPSKHPKVVWDHVFKQWINPFGEENANVSLDRNSKTWRAPVLARVLAHVKTLRLGWASIVLQFCSASWL